jgi:hypothetical protein
MAGQSAPPAKALRRSSRLIVAGDLPMAWAIALTLHSSAFKAAMRSS